MRISVPGLKGAPEAVPEQVPKPMPQSRQMFGAIDALIEATAPAKTAEHSDAGGTITAPITLATPWGDTIATNDVDALIAAFEESDRVYRTAREFRAQVAHALLANTEGDAKTRYVRGQLKRAKVELADDSWDQKTLMQCWETYPHYSRSVMKIASLRVAMREYRKIEKEAGAGEFMTFRDLLTKANLGPIGTPKISVVNGETGEAASAPKGDSNE